MQALSLSFVLLFFLSTFSINAATSKLPRGFSIDLLHRDSPLSPFYNSSMTDSERAQKAALRAMSRANFFRRSGAETDLIPTEGAGFLMRFFIGTPPIERWAAADTGSDFVWVQCSPCIQCYHQNAPLFDPKSSSTYKGLPCHSKSCAALPSWNCGTSSECTYYYPYGDKSYTRGELATESISFRTSCGGHAVSFPKTVFGCGHNSGGEFGSNVDGLVGLGEGGLSLVSQMGDVGRKFSYCLPPLNVNSTTKLRFGEEATLSENGVVSTPLIAKPGSTFLHFLNLEGITVGQQRVAIGQGDGYIVIDSGTTLTMLPSKIYDQVEALVKKAIGADKSIVQIPDYKLCYTKGSIKNVPDFKVHFTGASLSLKSQNIFDPVTNNVVCLAMLPTEPNGTSLYGNVAQVNFDVEYDLEQRKVSFVPVDCAKHYS